MMVSYIAGPFIAILLGVPAVLPQPSRSLQSPTLAKSPATTQPTGDPLPEARCAPEGDGALARLISSLRSGPRFRSVKELAAELDRVDAAVQEVLRCLPADQPALEAALAKIWESASHHDIQIQSVRTNKAIHHASFLEIPILVESKGSFPHIYAWFVEFGKSPIRVSSLELSKEPQGSVKAKILFVMPMRAGPASTTQPARSVCQGSDPESRLAALKALQQRRDRIMAQASDALRAFEWPPKPLILAELANQMDREVTVQSLSIRNQGIRPAKTAVTFEFQATSPNEQALQRTAQNLRDGGMMDQVDHEFQGKADGAVRWRLYGRVRSDWKPTPPAPNSPATVSPLGRR